MKKKIIWSIALVIVLLGIYFGYKVFNLYYYDVNNITTQDFETFVNQFNINNTITIKHKDIQGDDYFKYENIKIRNDFENFEEIEQNIDGTSSKLILKDENNKTKEAFWMGKTDTYVHLLEADKTLFGTEDNRITNANLTSILEKEKINDDIELFNYLAKQKYSKNNIFTSVKKMKENYAIKFMISVIMPTMNNITLIDGDYDGYIFNVKDNMKEVSILKNDKRYVFVFMNEDTLTDEYLIDILSTIVID